MSRCLDQKRTPIFEAIKKYVAEDTLPFHVPGHKQGRGLQEFSDFVGSRVMSVDLTCFEGTDNICNPLDVIKEAQELTAEAYGADHAFFLVNGTTSGIQAMIMSVCKPGDKIILPRNAHKSAIGGIILSGAVPIYVQPEVCPQHGIALAVTPEKVRAALEEHPDAKAVFVVNPTYYGFAPNLRAIVEIAHECGVPVLVDEAHGAHLPFHPDLPVSAIAAGADLSAASTHKLVGSLTQSSILLLQGELIAPERVKGVLNLSQTTSPSYILLASIDVARKQMALNGRELLAKTLELAHYARQELGNIQGLQVLGSELVGRPGSHAWDPTKVTVNVRNLGISGFEAETILRREYRIQVELADLYNLLFLFSIGDDYQSVNRLIKAMQGLAAGHQLKNVTKIGTHLPAMPELVLTPQQAFCSSTKIVDLAASEGEIAAEMIMAYPPGIPILCPGERITAEVIEYVRILKQENCQLQGTEDPYMDKIKVLIRHFTVVQPNGVSETAG